MSGLWKGVLGASRALAQAVGVIASRPPAPDKLSGPLDKELAGVDKISGDLDRKTARFGRVGAGSKPDQAGEGNKMRRSPAGFRNPQIYTCRVSFLPLVGGGLRFANRRWSRLARAMIARQPGRP